MTAGKRVDAFVDAGLDCREAGVLGDAVDALLATGALDDMIVRRRFRRHFIALAEIARKLTGRSDR